jgi:hypothetical protein
MSELQTTHRIDGFRGINNVQDPNRLQISKENLAYLTSADNTDITDDYRATRRSGFEAVYTGVSGIHSLYATDDTCLFVDGSGLYTFDTTFASSLIASGLTPDLRMYYTDVGQYIYFSNGVDKGYVYNSAAYNYMSPVDEFKKVMPSGKHLEYYDGRLYVADGTIIYVSDPYLLQQYDERSGLIPFDSNITFVKATNDALWVGTEKNVYLLQGGSPRDFIVSTKADYGAIENSAVVTTATNVGLEADGKVVIFATKRGVCACMAGGLFRNMTDDHYHFLIDVQNASALINTEEDKHQYIMLTELYTVGQTGRLATDFPFISQEMADSPWSLPTLRVSFTGVFA